MSAKRRKSGAAKRGSPRRAPTKKSVRAKKPAAKRARKAAPQRAPKKAPPRKRARIPSKLELRKQLRARRGALSPEAQRHAGEQAAALFVSTRVFLACKRIACYLPSDGEIDPSTIIERIWRMGKTAYLPVLSRMRHDRLWFAPAEPGMELTPNRYGIPEPRVHPRALVRAEKLDLILLPAVAVDAKGNRLGRGAGFYDRSLAFLRNRRFLRKPHLFGLVHDFQRVPALPAEAWDIPLDGVVTERAVYYINS